MEIVSEGVLNCWYGEYHYIEPWAGCEHDCVYCYAKFRTPVTEALEKDRAPFGRPQGPENQGAFLSQLAREVEEKKVVTAKLCRYTDIFSPRFVASGLSLKVLEVLCASPVKRIILTTKGVPDARIVELLVRHKPKISYNIGARPEHELSRLLEPGVPALKRRLDASAELARQGVEVTVHIDPILIGYDDRGEALEGLMRELLGRGLRKAVLSYLLLNDDIIRAIEEKLGAEKTRELVGRYELQKTAQIVKGESESQTHQLKREEHKESIDRVSRLMQARGFNFALCSLKAKNGVLGEVKNETAVCYGSFYA